MADADDEGGGGGPSPSGGAEAIVLIKGPGISPWIKKIRREHPHLGDSFARFNAADSYNRKVKKARRRIRREEEQATRAAESQMRWNHFYGMYPWDRFVPIDCSNLLELKGSVRLAPDATVTPVYCYPIITEQLDPQQPQSPRSTLVVLKVMDKETYYPSLCPVRFLPTELDTMLLNQWKSGMDGWKDLECCDKILRVDRSGVLMNLLSGALKNRTCDDAMLAALQNGAIGERASTKRKEWRVSPLPFCKGRELAQAHIIEYLPWGASSSLLLTLPKSRHSLVPPKIFKLAMSAKHLKCSRHSSLTGALDKLREYAEAPARISAHDRCLNIALGGCPLVNNNLGAMFPCKNQQGKYSQTPCSCDINYSVCNSEVKDRLRRIDPRKNGKNGCKTPH